MSEEIEKETEGEEIPIEVVDENEEDTSTEDLQKQVDFLTEELEKQSKTLDETTKTSSELDAKLQTTLAQYVRLQADFDNFRRRTRENESRMTETVTASVLKNFLPVLDNFDLALQQMKKNEAGEAYVQGLELLQKQILKAMNDLGVTEMDAEGKPFDPHFHEAVMQITNDELDDDVISMVFQKGYMYKDTVLRAARVQVSHKS